jgi:hypothetical protein
MTDRLPNVDNLCTNPDNHKLHICELTKAKKKAAIESLQDKPEFICGNCGQKANAAGSLCAPGPFHD